MWIYFLIVRIASLWNAKARLLVRGQAAALSLLSEQVRQGDSWIWFHAASSGEFEQARPVIGRLRAAEAAAGRHSKVLVTFFSPSGYEMHKGCEEADMVTYLPFATRRNARRFVTLLQPRMAVFIKYEYWPAYLRELRRQQVPVFSVASIFRHGQAFFRPLIGPVYRRLLRCFTRLLVQDEASQQRLARYGITRTAVCGDPRFNRVLEVAASSAPDALVDRFAADGAPLIVAGSTWPHDERLLARYVAGHPGVRLLLVPHEIDDRHLHLIFQLFQGRIVRYSEATERNADTCRVMVVDRMGMLARLYRYATVAYVGGGFGAGIHNTLEAAAYGVPVVWGPRWQRFREAEGLIGAGAGFSIRNYKELSAVLDTQLAAPGEAGRKAEDYVRSEHDAAERICRELLASVEKS